MQQSASDLVVGKTDRAFEIDILGQCVRHVGRHRDELGIAAAAARQVARGEQDFLPDGEVLHVPAHGGDAAGGVVAGIGRQRRHPFVEAGADQHVRLADTEGFGADQHIVVADLRRIDVDIVEDVRSPGRANQDCFHHRPLCDAGIRGAYSSTTGLRNTPIFSISTSTTSPAFMNIGGLRVKPTPAGVPVTITSPGTRSKISDE